MILNGEIKKNYNTFLVVIEYQIINTIVSSILTYIEENIPAAQNDRAISIKLLIYEVFDAEALSEDNKKRLKKVGTKELTLNFDSVYGVSGNNKVIINR